MKDLSLIPTEDLLAELKTRFTWMFFAHSVNDRENAWMFFKDKTVDVYAPIGYLTACTHELTHLIDEPEE